MSLILGNLAAGLDEIEPFLRLDFPDEYFNGVDKVEKAEFGRQLSELDSRAREGIVLVLVGPGCDWDASWISMALGKDGKIDLRRFLRPRSVRGVSRQKSAPHGLGIGAINNWRLTRATYSRIVETLA